MRDKEHHICWMCGCIVPVNASGVCEDCWNKYAYLRENNVKKRTRL